MNKEPKDKMSSMLLDAIIETRQFIAGMMPRPVGRGGPERSFRSPRRAAEALVEADGPCELVRRPAVKGDSGRWGMIRLATNNVPLDSVPDDG